MGRIAELEKWIETLQFKISNLEHENDELEQLLIDVAYYYDETLPRIREKLEK